jgi:hypothetical protein
MSEELWYVKLANGDVHRVTLDQLDGAFQAGHIDESTMVLAAGASTWNKLGDLAGIDNEDEAGGDSSATRDGASGLSDNDDSWDIPAHIAAAPLEHVARPTRGVLVQAQPTQYTAPAQYAAPAYAHAPAAYSHAPVVQAIPRTVTRTMNTVSMAAPSATPSYVPSSLRPMSVDLGDMDADVPFKRKSRKGFVVAVLGLAALAGGVGFAAQRAHIGPGSSDDIAHVAAAAAIAAPPPAPDPVVDPTSAPAAVVPAALAAAVAPSSPNTAPAEASPLNPQFTTRLNEGTKTKLLASDKAHEAKAKARHSRGGVSHGSSSKSKSTTFTTGGNKFDPLNSAI